MSKFTISKSLRRAGLLATTAFFAAGFQPLHAEDIGKPLGAPEAQANAGLIGAISPEAQASTVTVTAVLPDPQLSLLTNVGTAPAPEPQIVISNPGTPTTARDVTGLTGIGQMVVDQQNGFIGLCTGTLINPRTVIFAAHCVNSRAATAYGANSGGQPIAFGFSDNNNQAGNNAFGNWLNGTGKYTTSVARALYNVNQVVYNPYSLEPAARSFLYGDVALATLDTPAANIPTWALLFSPLTAPASVGASGTGYNVQLVGYGNNGSASTGSTGGIDFRRRAAENMIGALTDLKTFEGFLFGPGNSATLTQNLYFIDFDDPKRGLSGASPFDFNAFRDNARVTGGVNTEGITASGDSGGPLILQNFAKQVVVGTLSGGYTRFFNGQPANGYGTVSFYQPLYLYWDWIAANNPYHYVTAVAGDGQWTDASRWVTTLDPSYTILSGGSLINGIPTVAGEQKFGTSGDFGQICFQSGGSSDCLDTSSGVETYDPAGHPIGTAANDAGSASVTDLAGGTQRFSDGKFDNVVLESQASALALPVSTLANGLPGATSFVPNNANPVRTTGVLAKYFDVTLASTGTTTLSGANITIDRLTIGTAGAGLTIASDGSLTTLINTTQFAGTVTVNGTLTSVGDYSLLGGALLGSGRINAPFLTSILGQFAPGTATTISTLTIGGNLVMSSGTGYFVNLGSNGFSDRLAVVANGTSTGAANVGGTLNLSTVAGSIFRFNDLYTILTAQGGVTGTFATPSNISAILRSQLTYNANDVQLRVTAVPYAGVVNTSSAVQVSYAALLDANRLVGSQSGLYDVLDVQNQTTIQATLDALAPRTETLRSAIGTVVTDNNSRLIRQHMQSLVPGDLGGTIAYIGRPAQTAALVAGLQNNAGQSGVANGMGGFGGAGGDSVETRTGRLPDHMSAFIAGGYLDGKSRPMTTALPASGKDKFDGWYVAGGLESEVGDKTVAGLALSYTDINGDAALGSVKGKLAAGTIYAKHVNGAFVADGQFTAGLYSADSTRPGNLPGAPYTLRGNTDSLALSAEANVGAMFGEMLRFGPKVGVRWNQVGYDRSLETGGPTALVIDRDKFTSIEGRAGVELEGRGRIRPTASATFVHDFKDHPAVFGATFNGASTGLLAPFALTSQDHDWGELSAGLTFSTGRADISVGADTTVGRYDVENQAYRASVKIHF